MRAPTECFLSHGRVLLGEQAVTKELQLPGMKGSEVRCLLPVELAGTIWSGSTHKGGTHIWCATTHELLQSLDTEDGLHLMCATTVQVAAGAMGVDPFSGLSVWTGHTNGKVAQWRAGRDPGTSLIRSWKARRDYDKKITAICSGRDGSDGIVVWVGFADGVVHSYKAEMPDADGGIPPPTLLRECHAHHSGLQCMSAFTANLARPQGKLVTASNHGTLRSWNAAGDGGVIAEAGEADRGRAGGLGLYGGSEYVLYDTPAMHAFGRRVSLGTPEDRVPKQMQVILHVYDLGRDKKVFKALKAVNTHGLGAFHTALEIADWEWSFGWNDDGTTGVFSGLPSLCDMHTFREKLNLGCTTVSRTYIDKMLARLEDEWMGEDYDMLERNCCHFCNAMANELGVGELVHTFHCLSRQPVSCFLFLSPAAAAIATATAAMAAAAAIAIGAIAAAFLLQ
eukprot:SAG31_NODE_2795_length_5082_cov_2.673289_6_plen_452_part_00